MCCCLVLLHNVSFKYRYRKCKKPQNVDYSFANKMLHLFILTSFGIMRNPFAFIYCQCGNLIKGIQSTSGSLCRGANQRASNWLLALSCIFTPDKQRLAWGYILAWGDLEVVINPIRLMMLIAGRDHTGLRTDKQLHCKRHFSHTPKTHNTQLERWVHMGFFLFF